MTLEPIVRFLCSDECAGRAPGTPGGRAAREFIVNALREAGLDPSVQAVPGCNGANIIASLPGAIDRWILVGAHYDHLGREGNSTYRGADDNAAAVAILIEVARALKARPPERRGVLIVSFDAEEPPWFGSEPMGSEYFATHPPFPLDRIDLMVCMDLVGHAVGPEQAPDEIRQTLFAIGAERSAGTPALVDRLARAVPDVVVRRADAEVIPPLSDYWAFWERKIPFLFLTCGRNRYYHTPEDTPERLDFPKMRATATWLERLVRESCARPEPRVPFLEGVRDDASTLRSIVALSGRPEASALLAACGPDGRLPDDRRAELEALATLMQEGLA